MTLLVGVAPDREDPTPIELGALLARSVGVGLHLVSVVPEAWPTPVAREGNPEYAAWARERGEEATRSARAQAKRLAPDLEPRVDWVQGRSVGAGLLREARRLDSELVVVGSGGHGPWGRIGIGSAADRLLHASPVPVAVAPRGFRGSAPDEPVGLVRRVTCAFRGDTESLRTLRRTAEICARTGASLRVATFAVRGRVMHPPEVSGAEAMVHEQWIAQAREVQESAVEDVVAAGLVAAPVERVIGVGGDWSRALDSLAWRPDELLVLGSSPERLVERLFLGSSAGKIVRASPVPVVVVQ